ncbi:MAG TPA: ABC transporter permease [Solirubrobacteraceae bacterium]|nr:ABC transporter permease [Solirubrobacteraceae bacterium]
MTRLRNMVAADLLKLRKKRTMTWWAFLLTVGVLIAFYAYTLIAHATDPLHHGPAGGLEHWGNAMSTLGLDFGTVAAIMIGVEAGAAEFADGTFKELVVTGRSRLALFASRIPAALIVTLCVAGCAVLITTAATFAFAGGDPTPSLSLVLQGAGWVLLSNAVVCVVAVGLGALMGSRSAALISLIAWQTIASRLLMQTSALGGARKSVLDAALTQLKPGPVGSRAVAMSSLLAVIVIALWALIAAGVGAWRTQTRDA